jgi:tetratricopeptide (TPR) repeat protein
VIAAVPAGVLYFNAPARPWLLAQRPEALTPEDRDDRSERTRNFAQAVQNPKLFRKLDREYRFAVLLLVGDASQYRPLLDHLISAKDWQVAYLDHAGIIFRRGDPGGWKPSDVAALASRFSGPRDQATFLAQAAAKLIAVREPQAARELLDRATALDQSVPEAWNGLALLHMSRGEWRAALSQADRALSLDDEFLPALATKTQVLFSVKKFSDAYDLSKRLVERQPEDPGTLFYHAKVAHEAHAYREEIKVLEKLIALAEKEARPVTGYRIYLAQAHAAAGAAKPSIEQFQLVLADPELTAEQRTFAQETLAQVKSRSGL